MFSSTLSPKGFKTMQLFSKDRMFLTLCNKVTVTDFMPFFERLSWNSIFECSGDLRVWYKMKAYMCANMEAKRTWR